MASTSLPLTVKMLTHLLRARWANVDYRLAVERSRVIFTWLRLRSGGMGRLLSSRWARPVGQQLLCNADEHLSDVLLLADGQLEREGTRPGAPDDPT